MMSMLVKVLEEAAEPDKEPKEKQASAKDRLRQVMRGSGTLVGVVTAEKERNYVPSCPQPSYQTVLMIGKAEGDAGEYKPVKRKNYTPKRKKAEGNDEPLKEPKPIQSLLTILKKNLTKVKMTKWRPVVIPSKTLMHSTVSARSTTEKR